MTPAGHSPGAVDAHTHLYSGLVPLGMPQPAAAPRTFVEILSQIWWRLDRALDASSLRAAARLYIAEALLAGTTTLVDHHESPSFIDGSLDILADAADELGIRLAVTYGATERNGGRDEARRGLRESRRFIRENRRPLVRGLLGLHASFTISDETVREAGAIARELAVPVHVHVAEDEADVADARRRGYAGPLERLLALEGLTPRSILAHCVHLEGTQVQRAQDAGLWIAQNPRSNEANRIGYPRGLSTATSVVLGTDGFPADMDRELEALLRVGRANGEPEARLTARFTRGRRLATELFGVIANDDWIERDGTGAVGRVSVNGVVVVDEKALVRADIEEIRAGAREAAASLWLRMEQVR